MLPNVSDLSLEPSIIISRIDVVKPRLQQKLLDDFCKRWDTIVTMQKIANGEWLLVKARLLNGDLPMYRRLPLKMTDGYVLLTDGVISHV
ncbi:hypothetical protein DPMN_066210 [Dreissena polymorpha]|uniref:Uncharacterized protein n=1 Tax=Dreissena polymorpha TaxID=45954 RepID=A0A9D4BRV7_DREPO|nr:hypothetical protein DPMN_066210 [Dreissena polymorpha]